MNLRHSYEQLMADKLRKLPGPDADASWQQMKQLLEDEDRRTGGGKRPPGGGGWWRTGVIAIVLATSLWLFLEKPVTPGPVVAKNTSNTTPQKTTETAAGTSKKTVSGINQQTDAIDKKTTLSGTASTLTTPGKNNVATIAPGAAANSSKESAARIVTASTRKLPVETEPAINLASRKPVTVHIQTTPANREEIIAEGAGLQKTAAAKHNGIHSGYENAAASATPTVSQIHSTSRDRYTAADAVNLEAGYSNHTGTNNTKRNKQAGSNAGSKATPDDDYLPVNWPAATGEDWFTSLNDLKIPGNVAAATTSALADSIQKIPATTALLNNDTKKAVTKALRDKELEDITRKEKKSFHLNLSNVFKPFSLNTDPEPRWAAGIALNSGITVNAQSRYNYNMNAKSGTLLDYIPSLYLQFHLNDYVYAQTELNFISPQYTPQLLVSQQTSDLSAMGSPGTSQQKSIYIQKLYYFNLPVTLHYSPVNNFYLSAGLQFSSFQSGLVNIQEKQYTSANGPDHPGSVTNTVLKFKDDSIAAKLSPNEWRWQVGADYYIKRFTVGIRYNKAFNNLVNVNLSNTLPATPLRNQSLLFSVRYNLFESRKKGSGDQKN